MEHIPHPSHPTGDHRAHLLSVMERQGEITRPRLAEATGLSAMTVKRTADRLLSDGLLVNRKGICPVRGRLGTLLTFPTHPTLWVVDLSAPATAVYRLGQDLSSRGEISLPFAMDFSMEDNLLRGMNHALTQLRCTTRLPLSVAVILPSPHTHFPVTVPPTGEITHGITRMLTAAAYDIQGEITVMSRDAAATTALEVWAEADDATSAVYLATEDQIAIPLLRASRHDPWFVPACLAGLWDALDETGALRESRYLHLLNPDAVITHGELLSDTPVGGIRITTSRPLWITGAAVALRRRLWSGA